MFGRKRMTPPTCPARMRASSPALGCVPWKPVMIVWPTSFERGCGAADADGTNEAASARKNAALDRDMHLAADEHTSDVEVVVEHDDVRRAAFVDPPELIVAERAGGDGRCRSNRILEWYPESVQVAHCVDHRQDAPCEDAIGAAHRSALNLDVEGAEGVRALAAPGGGDRVGDERKASRSGMPGDERRLACEVHAVEDHLDDDVAARERGAGDTRVAVAERPHRVEDVGDHAGAAVERMVRLGRRRVAVP